MTEAEYQKAILDLQDKVKKQEADNKALAESNEKLTKDNADLSKANGELFMKVYRSPSKDETDGDVDEDPTDEDKSQATIDEIKELMNGGKL